MQSGRERYRGAAHSERACWPGARPWWAAGLHTGRSAALLPARQSPASADHPGLAAWSGSPI